MREDKPFTPGGKRADKRSYRPGGETSVRTAPPEAPCTARPPQKPGPQGLFRTSPSAPSLPGRGRRAVPGPRGPVPFPTPPGRERCSPCPGAGPLPAARRPGKPFPGGCPRPGAAPGSRSGPGRPRRRPEGGADGKPAPPFRQSAAGDETKGEAEEKGLRGAAGSRPARGRARRLTAPAPPAPPFIRRRGSGERPARPDDVSGRPLPPPPPGPRRPAHSSLLLPLLEQSGRFPRPLGRREPAARRRTGPAARRGAGKLCRGGRGRGAGAEWRPASRGAAHGGPESAPQRGRREVRSRGGGFPSGREGPGPGETTPGAASAAPPVPPRPRACGLSCSLTASARLSPSLSPQRVAFSSPLSSHCITLFRRHVP